jgi:hypothetical protein
MADADTGGGSQEPDSIRQKKSAEPLALFLEEVKQDPLLGTAQ